MIGRRTAGALALAAGCALAPVAVSQEAARDRLAALRAEAQASGNAAEAVFAYVRLAEATLDALSRDASDSAALVGMPTPAQVARVRRGASDAGLHNGRADLLLREALGAIESHPDFAERRDLQDRRSALAVEFGEFRMSMVTARVGAVLASVYPPEAGDAVSVAQNGVDAVQSLDLRDPVLLARRDIVYGVAASLGASAPARGEDAEPASAHFSRALRRTEDLASIEPRAFVEASLGLSRALAGAGRREEALRRLDALAQAPPFVDEQGEPAPAYRLLLADARFLADRAPRAGETGAEALGRALETYAQRVFTTDAGVPTEDRRALALDKLSLLETPELAPGAPLPPLLAAARARAAAQDPGGRDEAIALLGRSLTGRRAGDAIPFAEAEARWRLAALLLERVREGSGAQAGDRVEAMRLLESVARGRPDFPDARAAMDAAGRLAVSLIDSGSDEARDEAARALRLGVDRYADLPGADRWRLALADLTDDEALRRALLEAIDPDSPEGLRAQSRLLGMVHEALVRAEGAQRAQAAGALLERFETLSAALSRAEAPTELRDALRARAGAQAMDALLVLEREAEALETARRLADAPGAERWTAPLTAHLRRRMARAHKAGEEGEAGRLAALFIDAAELRLGMGLDPSESARVRVALAQALLIAERCEAAQAQAASLIDSLGRREDLLLLSGDALRCAGEDARAFALYREVAAPLERRGSRTEAFWRSWAGMLEILLRRNSGGDRTRVIRREIGRLRALDANLGDARTKRRIEAVEAALP